MIRIGNLIFGLQLLLAQVMFLYGAPRRNYFILRFLLSVFGFLAICYFYPQPDEIVYEVWFLVIRFLSLFFISTLFVWFTFDISYSASLSLCGAGYAVQHLSYQASNVLYLSGWFTDPKWGHMIAESIIFPLLYVLFFFLFAKPASRRRHYENIDYRFDIVSVAILLICVGLSRLTRSSKDSIVILSTALYAITCCISALVIQFYLRKSLELHQEKKVIQNLWNKDKKHYELSKENMEILNIKAHDLKHKISAYNGKLPQEEIESMKKVIDAYDSHLKTGNDSLDVILNEKNNNCIARDISFTYLGDGKVLSFMETLDIYSLLGNALDNAIEAVSKIEEKEKKVISMNLEKKGDTIFISVRNYSLSPLHYTDGELETSKETEKGYHGYGLKSIRRIAQKYQGDITYHLKENIFTLTVYLKNNKVKKND